MRRGGRCRGLRKAVCPPGHHRGQERGRHPGGRQRLRGHPRGGRHGDDHHPVRGRPGGGNPESGQHQPETGRRDGGGHCGRRGRPDREGNRPGTGAPDLSPFRHDARDPAGPRMEPQPHRGGSPAGQDRGDQRELRLRDLSGHFHGRRGGRRGGLHRRADRQGGPGGHLSPCGGPVAHGSGGRQGLLPVRHVCRPDGLHGRRQQRRAL